MSGGQLHRAGAMLLSALMALVGIGLLVEAISSSAFSVGRLLLGVLFLGAGIGRLYIELRRSRRA